VKITERLEKEEEQRQLQLYGIEPPKLDSGERPELLAYKQLKNQMSQFDQLIDTQVVKNNVKAQMNAIRDNDFKTIDKLQADKMLDKKFINDYLGEDMYDKEDIDPNILNRDYNSPQLNKSAY